MQSIVLLLGLTPIARVFGYVYALGLRRLIAALSRNPGIACIFGCGSYFDGRPTYGLSDIDLIIVLRQEVTRSDAAPAEIAQAYERVRRFFPFLGRWYEKQANLIFLSDVADGFPAPESFRVRAKQGKLALLYGDPPSDLISGPVTIGEVLAELTTLLRLSIVTDPRYAQRLAFWKRVFRKMIALAEMAELPEMAAAMRARLELAFISESDTRLFFSKAKPAQLYSLQLTLARQICDALHAREPEAQVQFLAAHPSTIGNDTSPDQMPALSPAVAALERSDRLSVRSIASVPIGMVPGLLYFPIDERIPLLELREAAYLGLTRLRRAMDRQPVTDENVLVSAEGFLFVATRQPTFVDVVPLDPLQFANVYAAASGRELTFSMPASLLAEQEESAERIFRAIASQYRANEAHVTKLPYPCIYRENDVEVVEKALRILRIRAAHSRERVLVQRSSDLLEYLRQRHPECRDFLSELDRYGRFLYGGPDAVEVANNVYRCLNQFMWQFISDVPAIMLDPVHKHLNITVGVITRNRAGDLANMLDSLTRQRRLPDEVLVVDNGSTDHTQAVLDGFRGRLTIRSRFLAEASIPRARNLVLEEARHDIVSFIDDDCISEPEWLAAVERGFLRADNIGVVGGWVKHEPAARPSTVDNYYRVFHHTKS